MPTVINNTAGVHRFLHFTLLPGANEISAQQLDAQLAYDKKAGFERLQWYFDEGTFEIDVLQFEPIDEPKQEETPEPEKAEPPPPSPKKKKKPDVSKLLVLNTKQATAEIADCEDLPLLVTWLAAEKKDKARKTICRALTKQIDELGG